MGGRIPDASGRPLNEGVDERMIGKRKTGGELLSIVGACVVVALLAAPSVAQKPFLERAKKVYALQKEKNGSCKLCHQFDKEKGESPEKDNINTLGKDLQKLPEMKPLINKDEDYKFTPADLDLFEKVMKLLDDKDADGDGASNIEELALGTFPSDSKSIPTQDELTKYRKENPKK